MESFSKEAWDIVRWPFASLVIILSWLGKREVKKIEQNAKDLEEFRKESVTTKEFNETLMRLTGDIKDGFGRIEKASEIMRREVREDIKEIHQRIDDK
jgi:hypothetical protein